MVAISGRVATAPWYKISKAGNGYCEFSILDAKEKAHHCIAFDRGPNQLAKKLDEELKLDSKVTVQGEIKNSKLFISSFVLIDKLNEVHGRKHQAVIKPHPLDPLMDKLGGLYVTQRVRTFLGTGDIRKVMKGFDLAGYNKLMSELWDEAARKEI